MVIHRTVLYGTTAEPLPEKDETTGHTHKWKVYLRGARGEDISVYISRVLFKLHPTYDPPVRLVKTPPFEVEETGWGEFDIDIKVFFRDPKEKPVEFHHPMKLFHSVETPQNSKDPVISDQVNVITFTNPSKHFMALLQTLSVSSSRDSSNMVETGTCSIPSVRSGISSLVSHHRVFVVH